MSSVTFLPLRLKRPWRTDRQDDKPLPPKPPAQLTVREKLTAARSRRVATFFRAKARQRVGVQALATAVGSSSGAVMAMLRSLRRLFTGFSRPRGVAALFNGPSKWQKRLSLLPSLLTGERSLLSMAQRTLGRALANLPLGRAEKQAQAERERRRQRVRIYRWVCQALARMGRSAIAAAHKRYRVEGATRMARDMVSTLMDEECRTIGARLAQERLAHRVRRIQRMWRRSKARERAALEAKARLINLLTDLTSSLPREELTRQRKLEAVHATSVAAVSLFVRRAAQRLGARLIQRVWRGHCARQRVRRLRDWRMRKLLRRRQRERLREARGALLEPSEKDKRYRQELETRVLARQQDTPVLPLLQGDRHQSWRRGERATLLEPLPLQTRPPRISSVTRTKVQCVPFSRFEKMIAQDARVNLSNVWVAIPVAHEDVEQPREASVSRRCELSPLLVGKGRKKVKGGLKTTYDWVPAQLLQSKEERLATASRRRPASPSATKAILLPEGTRGTTR